MQYTTYTHVIDTCTYQISVAYIFSDAQPHKGRCRANSLTTPGERLVTANQSRFASYGSSLCSCSQLLGKPTHGKIKSRSLKAKKASIGEEKINPTHKTKETDLNLLKSIQVKFPVLTSQGVYILMEKECLKAQFF